MRFGQRNLRKILATPAAKIAALIAAALGFGLAIWAMWGLPSPSEENRVRPTTGEFSIIKPPQWEAKIAHRPPGDKYATTITLSPQQFVGKEERIFVGLLRQPPDLEQLQKEGFRRGTFQQSEALIREETLRREFLWRAIFQRKGQWFEISLRLQQPQDVLRSDYWPYLTSFKTDQ